MSTRIRAGAALAAATLALTACSGGDDGATVRELDASGSTTGSASGSASGSGSGSASGSAAGSESVSGSGSEVTGASAGLGGYTPVSDVAAHANVTLDVCDVNDLLGADTIDFDAVRAIYQDGGNSVNGDGSVRTLAGFATSERDEPVWNTYVDHYGDATWLDTFVSAALDGTGPFEGEADSVRRQGVQKGLQNQVMVAWTIHELVAAQAKAADGDLDPASGAPHNWDEAWAFYHGAGPACGGPFATADKRGENFGQGTAVNDAILAAFQDGLQAMEDGDAAAVDAASAEIQRQITITYLQASIRYAHKIDEALADGDEETARVQQAEGWSFFRVIEPLVAQVDADAAATVAGVYDLASPPAAGSAEAVLPALESTFEGLGVTAAEVGELQ